MLVVEIVDGKATLVVRETLAYEDLNSFVDGPVEGVSLSSAPEAQFLVAYVNAEGSRRYDLRENCFLQPRRAVYGRMLIVGVDHDGGHRGLSPEELDQIGLSQTPRSPLPTLVFGAS